MSGNQKQIQAMTARVATSKENSASDASLPAAVQGKLGQKLREVYGQLLSEPLPDKFTVLLQELAKSEKKP